MIWFGWALWAVLTASLLSRWVQPGHFRYISYAIIALLLVLPLLRQGSLASYLIAAFDLPSITLTGVLFLSLFWGGRDEYRWFNWSISVISTVVVISYLFGYSWVWEIGYSSFGWVLPLVLAAVAMFLQQTKVLIILVIAAVVHSLDLYQSANIWSSLVDPWWVLIFIAMIVKTLVEKVKTTMSK